MAADKFVIRPTDHAARRINVDMVVWFVCMAAFVVALFIPT